MDTFLKAIMKKLHALFLHPHPDSPFLVILISTKVFLHFWKKVEVVGGAKFRLYGMMVRSSFSIASRWLTKCEA
jgi:hypothetical protein